MPLLVTSITLTDDCVSVEGFGSLLVLHPQPAFLTTHTLVGEYIGQVESRGRMPGFTFADPIERWRWRSCITRVPTPLRTNVQEWCLGFIDVDVAGRTAIRCESVDVILDSLLPYSSPEFAPTDDHIDLFGNEQLPRGEWLPGQAEILDNRFDSAFRLLENGVADLVVNCEHAFLDGVGCIRVHVWDVHILTVHLR